MIFQFISLKYFLISFAFGLLFMSLSSPTNKVIVVYPTPENAGHIDYQDKALNCFQFDAMKKACPSKLSFVKTIPFQT
jgi:hypothetical protein